MSLVNTEKCPLGIQLWRAQLTEGIIGKNQQTNKRQPNSSEITMEYLVT